MISTVTIWVKVKIVCKKSTQVKSKIIVCEHNTKVKNKSFDFSQPPKDRKWEND